MPVRILTIFGTRPEAIKLAPLVRLLGSVEGIEAKTCVTAQHRQMLDQVLSLFRIVPDFDLNLMTAGQSLPALTGLAIEGVSSVLRSFKPDRIVVQGDTLTTFAASLAAYYEKIPIAHVEAGLRTGNLYAPWPEEANRRMTTVLADLHFAPTETARDNLLKEGVSPSAIQVTGNTVIDALLALVDRLDSEPDLKASCEKAFGFLDKRRRLILVTGHRRENFGAGLQAVFSALARLAERKDVQIVYPVHLNPNVQGPARAILDGRDNVFLLPPQDYPLFVSLMRRAYLIVTDSGGIQEEAPGLGKPVLVTREVTERPEAIAAGTAKLVGTNGEKLVAEVTRLLDDPAEYQHMAQAVNPFGDGHASERILATIRAAH